MDDILRKQGLNPLPDDGDFGPRWEGGEDHLNEILAGWFCPDQIGSSWDPTGSPQGSYSGGSTGSCRGSDYATSEGDKAQPYEVIDNIVEIIRDHGPGGTAPWTALSCLWSSVRVDSRTLWQASLS